MVKQRPPAVEQTDPEDDSIILSIRLASGRFESSIQVPLFVTDEERAQFVDNWLNMMEAGIKCGRGRRRNSAAESSS